jgi:prepilin-type N-terminal cleavage/methylation domain-containing protein
MKTLQNLKSKKGFTLVELLVVIAILAVLAVAVVVVLNPAELLKQARDSTRISDLAAINSALALYFADATPSSVTQATKCTVGTSFPGGGTACTASTSTVVTGTGWVAINFTAVSSGSPLAKFYGGSL